MTAALREKSKSICSIKKAQTAPLPYDKRNTHILNSCQVLPSGSASTAIALGEKQLFRSQGSFSRVQMSYNDAA